MKAFVEGPLPIVRGRIRQTFIAEGEDLLRINKAANLFRRPFDGVNVERSARSWQFRMAPFFAY